MKNSMFAARYFGDGSMRLEEIPVPKLEDIYAPRKYPLGDSNDTILLRKNDLVLLEVLGASICGTDLHILTGEHGSAPPVTLGHEYVGRVLEIGNNVHPDAISVGNLVAVDPNIKCYECDMCKMERENQCQNLTTLGIFVDGGFAQYNVAPASQLYKLPDDIPVERAIFFEPLSCVLHGLGKLPPIKNQKVRIFGAGPIGCYFAMLCLDAGAAEVVVSDINDFRLNFVQSLGAAGVGPDEDLRQEYFDVVIDACGVPGLVPQEFECARRGGHVLLFGQQNAEARVEINPTLINQKELTVVGSYAADGISLDSAARELAHGKIPFERLITHRVSLENIETAFEAMRSGEAMEVLITPTREINHA